MKVILQTNQSDCLLACAAMIMNTLGCKVPVYKLIEKIELSMAGSNILQLKEALGEYGFSVEGYKIDVQSLNQTIMPVIAYVKNGHFIVLDKMSKNQFTGVDPAIGRIKYSFDEFQKIYSGVIVKIRRVDAGRKSEEVTRKSLLSFLADKRLFRILAGLLVTSIFTQVVAMSYSYMYSMVGNGETYGKVMLLLCGAVILLGIGSIMQGVLTKKFNILYEQIYGNRLVDKLMSKNYKFFSFRSNGDLLYRINARGMIKDALLLKLVPSFISLCTIIFVQILLLVQNSLLGILFLGAIILYLVVYVGTSKIAYMESNKYTQKVIQLNTTSENIIRSVSTIKVLGVSSIFTKKWHEENQQQAECYGELVVIQSFQNILTNIFTYIVPIAVSILSIACDEEINIFSQMALLPLLYLVVQNVVVIGQACNSIYTVLPNIDKATELLDDEFMQDNERKFAKLDGNTAIQVNDMSYHYGSLQCLEKVNIRIEKGKKYAVIGKSGCGKSGKSTMLKILANLLNDYHGEVVFDEQCREKPIYLDQDTTILDGSILENVLFGQTCTNERLIQISEAIGLNEVVGRQPQNWGTEIVQGTGTEDLSCEMSNQRGGYISFR